MKWKEVGSSQKKTGGLPRALAKKLLLISSMSAGRGHALERAIKGDVQGWTQAGCHRGKAKADASRRGDTFGE